MAAFWHETEEVPDHVRVLEVGLWVSLLSVDEVRELLWVSDEEYRGVVSNHVPVALFRIKLYCESSGVSFSISTALFSTNS